MKYIYFSLQSYAKKSIIIKPAFENGTEIGTFREKGRGCVGGLTQPLMDFFNGGGNVLVEVEHVVEEVVHGLEATEVVCHLCHPVVAVEIRFVEVGYHDVFLHLQVFSHGI